jgi:hypothetical protein
MEPPAKRLRILQSVEVDETNPDYVEAKQKQQQKFKGRLESIFAKFEGMHESMSDEIDFVTNKIVVDRGHLRRLDRQEKRQPGSILNDFLGAGPAHDDAPEESGSEDSEDELAPTQAPKAIRDTSSPLPHDAHPDVLPPHPIASVVPQTPAQQGPNTPNPSANLLQLVQFPQTPQGQQAQTTFYATLQQTINQAVQQAVAPFFSNMLLGTPAAQRPLVTPFTLPTTPATTADAIAPATDPKWYFPPMHTVEPTDHTAQSSPSLLNTKTPLEDSRLADLNKKAPALSKSVPHSTKSSNKKAPVKASVRENNGVNVDTENHSSPVHQIRASPRVEIPQRQPVTVRRKLPGHNGTKTKTTRPAKDTPTQRRRSSNGSPTVEETPETTGVVPVPKKSSEKAAGSDAEPSSAPLSATATRKQIGSLAKYIFTEEDDLYIIKQRNLHRRTWPEIRASKEKWKDWHMSAFWSRWRTHLRDKSHHLKEAVVPIPSLEASSGISLERTDQHSSVEIPESSPQPHHLPTPSSIRQDEDCSEIENSDSQRHFNGLPSSRHYNDDELELLSIQSADTGDEQSQTDEDAETDIDEDAISTSPDDVLPSIEGCEFVDEDALQQDLLQGSDDEDDEDDAREDSIPQKYHTAVPSPTQTRTQAPDYHHHHHPSTPFELNPNPDSPGEDDLSSTRHNSASISPALIGNDDPVAHAHAHTSPSPAPYIKRESLTPQPSIQVATSSTPAFATPRAAPRSSGLLMLSSSQGSASAEASGDSKLSRKAFLAQVKKSWARTPGSKAGVKRKSLQGLPVVRKRDWDEAVGSEDELAG